MTTTTTAPTTINSSRVNRAPEFDRSLAQRFSALDRANAVRTQRAALKRDLKAGRVSIYALLIETPDYLATAKVYDLLLATPKYGRVKANKILSTCRISPSKTIGGLSQRQREEIIDHLPLAHGTTVPDRRRRYLDDGAARRA